LKSDFTINQASVDYAYHPNISRDEKAVCLGDLEGKPFLLVLEKLPVLLETINLDSCYEDDPQVDAEDIFIRANKEKTVTVFSIEEED
ncbi:MAG TPA: hypothetical protein PKN66_10325, partial [Thermodesulfovibrio thiophilus]|nr:hypothetical protein [Thermodesulfovibrio thiophilus]